MSVAEWEFEAPTQISVLRAFVGAEGVRLPGMQGCACTLRGPLVSDPGMSFVFSGTGRVASPGCPVVGLCVRGIR